MLIKLTGTIMQTLKTTHRNTVKIIIHTSYWKPLSLQLTTPELPTVSSENLSDQSDPDTLRHAYQQYRDIKSHMYVNNRRGVRCGSKTLLWPKNSRPLKEKRKAVEKFALWLNTCPDPCKQQTNLSHGWGWKERVTNTNFVLQVAIRLVDHPVRRVEGHYLASFDVLRVYTQLLHSQQPHLIIRPEVSNGLGGYELTMGLSCVLEPCDLNDNTRCSLALSGSGSTANQSESR